MLCSSFRSMTWKTVFDFGKIWKIKNVHFLTLSCQGPQSSNMNQMNLSRWTCGVSFSGHGIIHEAVVVWAKKSCDRPHHSLQILKVPLSRSSSAAAAEFVFAQGNWWVRWTWRLKFHKCFWKMEKKDFFFSLLFVLLGLDVVPVPRVCLFTSFAQSVNISWFKIFIILYVQINN